jgi:hypothetical protein
VVQLEQTALLRCLVKHHHLRRLLAEGLTPRGMPVYREIVAALGGMERQLADLRKQRALEKGEAVAIDREIGKLAREHRRRLLEYGAPGVLAVTGAVEVLPLDADGLLDRAKPITPDGKVREDPAKLRARHDGHVRAALASGPCALIVLGGSHDLSASVRRLGKGTTEYLRVTTTGYREVAGGE